jgi:hypothetical protein
LEAIGDCPEDQIDGKIDELFDKAKRSIERQVNSEINLDERPHRFEIKNGNGKERYEPATDKQKNLISKLAKEKNQFITGMDDLSKLDANYVIKDLLTMPA